MALPGNRLFSAGTIALGIWAWGSRRLPRVCGVGLPALVLAGLILGEFGGTLLPAALVAYLGMRPLRA